MRRYRRQSRRPRQSEISFLFLVEQSGGHGAAADFARSRLWNVFDDVELLGALEFRQTLSAEFQKHGFADGFAQYHGGGYFFIELRVRESEGDRLRDGRMPEQHSINFMRRDFLAGAIDLFFQAPGEMEITVLVEEAFIAGAEPAIHEGSGI